VNGKVAVKRNGEVLIKGRRNTKGIYVLDLKTLKSRGTANLGIRKMKPMEIHRTLGHLNGKQLEKVVKTSIGLEMVGIIDRDEVKACGVCRASKQIRKSFRGKFGDAKAPGEVIHADLGFFDEEQESGVKCWVDYTCEYSGASITYVMRTKGEQPTRFREVTALLENLFGLYVKKLICDGGKEFVNDAMERFCREKGIILQVSSPYTQEQNGLAERQNRIKTILMSIILSVRLPHITNLKPCADEAL